MNVYIQLAPPKLFVLFLFFRRDVGGIESGSFGE